MKFRDVALSTLNERPGLASLLDSTWAVRVEGALDAETCARMTDAVYAARAEWVADFRSTQFTLGRAWYAHLEQDRPGDYFARAAETNAIVERALPGMQDEVRALMSAFMDEPVTARRGWCGPGVHVFPAGGKVARVGGDVHFDEEGLSEAQLRDRPPALSFVLMLQAPESGGAIRLWDALYEGASVPTPTMLDRERVDVPYAAGTLVVFSSYRLHQIQPFGGSRDRVSVTAHLARLSGAWESWF